MKDWEKFLNTLQKEIETFEENFEKKFKDLDEKIEEKVSKVATKTIVDFVTENEKRCDKERTEREAKSDGKPVYEYRANGFVTSVYSDGTKTVTSVTPDGEEKDAPADGKREKTKGDKILGMVPFLDEESLHELTVQFLDGDLEIEMAEVLPFLGEDDIALIMQRLVATEGDSFKGLEIADILPFADEDDIGELFKKRAREGVIDEDLLSYIDDDCWHELVAEYCENEDSNLDIDKIYPHLDEDDLKLLFKTYLKRQK